VVQLWNIRAEANKFNNNDKNIVFTFTGVSDSSAGKRMKITG
jgi:hypothetical protein